MEGLKVSEAELNVILHPSKSINVSHAIFHQLNSMLFKFNETFDGVLLAYSASYFNDTLAKILPGLNPSFGVRLKAQLLLFQPKPSMILEGKVVKLSQQSIHVIVLGFSSATIIIEEDMEDNKFVYKVKHGKQSFVSKANRRHKIEVGTFIRFAVQSFDEDILHILGSLVPSNTGNVNWLDKHADEDLVESNRKKRRDDDGIKKSKKHKSSHS